MPAISFQNVVKTYAGQRGPVHALDGVSFDIEQGEFFGLLGPNGAGKTTLISILAGLASATSGNVSVLGHDVVADYAAARMKLGVVPQELVFDPFFTVREALRIQGGYFGVRNNDAWIDELLANLGLEDKADANMRQLSGGMKRRVLVAQALVHRPPVIVLDEPTAGVDIELRQQLWEYVRELHAGGTTVVLTTHYLEEAEALCDRIAIVNQGAVVANDLTSTLLAMAQDKVLVVTVDADLSTVPDGLGGRAVLRGPRALGITYDKREMQAGDILHRLTDAGIGVVDVSTQEADLEDVFLQLIRPRSVQPETALETAHG